MIVLPPSEDRFHHLKESGSYEWTYFDGLSEDGEHGFTAIWFRGIPMSPYYTATIDRNLGAAQPERYCAFAFGLYHRGTRIASGLEEGLEEHFFGDQSSPDVRFAENSLHSAEHSDGTTGYRAKIDIRRPLLAGRILGEIEFRFPKHDPIPGAQPYKPEAGRHFWVPAAPNGSFSAALDLVRTGTSARKYRFKGRAYHDRNFGSEPLHHLNLHWNWGRVHFDSKAFVFFDIHARQNQQNADFAHFKQLLVFENGKVIDSVNTVDVETHEMRNHWSTLPYPSAFYSGKSDTGPTFRAETVHLLDSGPFYHRMASRFNVQAVQGGEGQYSGTGLGITEYLRPSRLGVSVFRPFVKFRVRRLR